MNINDSLVRGMSAGKSNRAGEGYTSTQCSHYEGLSVYAPCLNLELWVTTRAIFFSSHPCRARHEVGRYPLGSLTDLKLSLMLACRWHRRSIFRSSLPTGGKLGLALVMAWGRYDTLYSPCTFSSERMSQRAVWRRNKISECSVTALDTAIQMSTYWLEPLMARSS